MNLDRNNPIKALIVDMDGVLWRQSQPIGDLPRIFEKIRQKNLKITLATNNATLTVSQYLQKLASFGVNLSPEQIVNSPQAAAAYMVEHFPRGSLVFVIGKDGLRQELQSQGFVLSDGQAQDVCAVVVGMDWDLRFEQLCQATLLLRAGAEFIATNSDRTFPTPQGLIPGVGAILALLETATDRKPIVVGKPDPLMYQIALQRMEVSPAECLVVGDRLETDILGGQNLGCKTALVLSGVTTLDQAQKWAPLPNMICQNLEEVVDRL
ncbi:MAG: HAD-IIA family hydrolase [Anaerolineales bacterium]|nr:HAD-IIA family hydrolase [Anaerolineales bacterium]MCS7247088.1 HAD-IIA family hydrolase [Anaerolineales bacterium]MDW8160899.1 HAD-IIA family hydrolase [Anaerolineales bacterium]MDW8446873.1 HAD-IIA family hydrolase [Anaerolineales bacterium]